MSPHQSEAEVVFNRPSTDPDETRVQPSLYVPRKPRETSTPVREVVRLFQCRQCSKPYQEAVGLPCGNHICKRCIPETYVRINISFPDTDDRRLGFMCPCEECAKEHALGDCNVDVLLKKSVALMQQSMIKGKDEALRLGRVTNIALQDPWQATGVPSLGQSHAVEGVIGGQCVSTWILAEEGTLPKDAEVSYEENGEHADAELAAELQLVNLARAAIREEMDCQVCYALYFDPLTAGCGHTFCRACLHRVLDHSDCCPVCRKKLTVGPLLDRGTCSSNEALIRIIENFWWDELLDRKETLSSEEIAQQNEFNLSLFVCTLSFPYMPTFLHVFEPRYRLMIRRCMEGNQTFGMVLPKRQQTLEDAYFHPLGTLLRITNVQYYSDGRSLVEAVGLSRFRIRNHGQTDGYAVGNIDRIDDVSLQEEEAVESREAQPATSPDAGPNGVSTRATPATTSDLETMSTQDLMSFAADFVLRMRLSSAPWLTERLLAIYGEPPGDPAIFSWWFASMLPIRDLEKYRLLGTSSVRNRLKICCGWIVVWQTSRWMTLIDRQPGLSRTASSSDEDEEEEEEDGEEEEEEAAAAQIEQEREELPA